MEKLLSDIDISRSVSVATFLELEAAARSCRCYLDAPCKWMNMFLRLYLQPYL